MEKSSPLTSRSQPRWGRYPILPNPITRGNAASTNTPTASSDSTFQKVQISLLCQIPMSKGSRINSTLAPEGYSATELLVRFSSTPKIFPLHFAVEWAAQNNNVGGRARFVRFWASASGFWKGQSAGASWALTVGLIAVALA